MPNYEITILNGNPVTGVLELDKPEIVVETTSKVKWIIKPGTPVCSIVDILDKSGYKDVWSTRPKKNNSWEGKIKSKHDIPTLYHYEYSIRWKAADKIPPDYDPKISVDPSFAVLDFIQLVVGGLVIALMALFTLKFFSRKNSRK